MNNTSQPAEQSTPRSLILAFSHGRSVVGRGKYGRSRQGLQDFLEEVRGTKWREPIRSVRELHRKYLAGEAKKKAVQERKRNLLEYVVPAVGWNGAKGQEQVGTVDWYSGLGVFDFDGLENAEEVRDELAADPVVVAAFVSPSGSGVKALVVFESLAGRETPDRESREQAAEEYLRYWRAASRYLLARYPKLAEAFDESGKDCTRACYLSHDPKAEVGRVQPWTLALVERLEGDFAGTMRREWGVEVSEEKEAATLVPFPSTTPDAAEAVAGEEKEPEGDEWGAPEPAAEGLSPAEALGADPEVFQKVLRWWKSAGCTVTRKVKGKHAGTHLARMKIDGVEASTDESLTVYNGRPGEDGIGKGWSHLRSQGLLKWAKKRIPETSPLWLGSNKHTLSPFGAFVLLRHCGNQKGAARAIAKAYGLEPEPEPGNEEQGSLPEIYYHAEKSRFLLLQPGAKWTEDKDGGLKAHTRTAAKTILRGHYGLVTAKKTDADPADELLDEAITYRCIDAVLDVPHFSRGVHRFEGKDILVKTNPERIEPKQGSWENLHKLLTLTLGDEQADWFFWWMATNVKDYYAATWQNRPVLVVVGPSDSWKTFLQTQVITRCVGSREGNPRHMAYGSSFNADLVTATHLMMSDQEGLDRKERANLQSFVKRVANEGDRQRVEPKGQDAYNAPTWWVMSISVNPSDESLRALPNLDEYTQDKVAMLWARKPRKDYLPEVMQRGRKKELAALMDEELPAFIFDCLNAAEVPEKWQGRRSAVRAYHHPKAAGKAFQNSEHGRVFSSLVQALDLQLPQKEMEDGGVAKFGYPQSEHTFYSPLALLKDAKNGNASLGIANETVLGNALSALAQAKHPRVARKPNKRNKTWKYRILPAPPEEEGEGDSMDEETDS